MEIREIRDGAEGARLEQLLSRGFGVPAGASFYDDFPAWDPRHGLELIRLGAIDAEAGLVASAGARLAWLKEPRVLVGIVGVVVTEERFRGRGLASRLVAEVCARAGRSGARHLFLFGSEHEMYRRLGFELWGEQLRLALPMSEREEATEPVHRGWTPALMEPLMARPQGLLIRREDAAWIGAHRNIDWRWIGEHARPRAYAAIGKGIDLGGMIHEWGGEQAALRELLDGISREREGLQLLGPPELVSRIGLEASARVREFLCMRRSAPGAEPLEGAWLWGLDSA